MPYVQSLPPDDPWVPLAFQSFIFLSSLLFTFYSCHWHRPSMQTEQSQNWCLICHWKFRFCWVRLPFVYHSAVVFREQGKKDTNAICREETFIRYNPKICIRYSILLVIFVFNTSELVKQKKKNLISSTFSKKKLKTVNWCKFDYLVMTRCGRNLHRTCLFNNTVFNWLLLSVLSIDCKY